jgi:hypothetical protein
LIVEIAIEFFEYMEQMEKQVKIKYQLQENQNDKKTLNKKTPDAYFFVSFVFITGCITSAPKEVVKTVSGRVKGESRDGVVRFLGIPYAQSIAGRNRFAPPQPVEPWTDVLQVVRYADSSPQQAADPTGASPVTPASAVLPEWPVFTKDGRESMHIDATSWVGPYMEPAIVKLFHDMLWKRAGLK